MRNQKLLHLRENDSRTVTISNSGFYSPGRELQPSGARTTLPNMRKLLIPLLIFLAFAVSIGLIVANVDEDLNKVSSDLAKQQKQLADLEKRQQQLSRDISSASLSLSHVSAELTAAEQELSAIEKDLDAKENELAG